MKNTWLMTEDAYKKVLSIAHRDGSIDALLKETGKTHRENYALKVRDGIGIIQIHGPLIPHADLFSCISGATSYESIAGQLKTAIEDPLIHSILLSIDSPGGAVAGCEELSKMIFEARHKKTIVAFVEDLMCSAAYWLGSATSKVYAQKNSLTGSIGCIATYMDDSKALEMEGLKELTFVSSNSPRKGESPATEGGAAAIQAVVDEIGINFAENVAKNRGVSIETVNEKYGQGSFFSASKALKRSMIDAIVTGEEDVIAELNKTRNKNSTNKIGGQKMTPEELKAQYPETYKAIYEQGKTDAKSGFSEKLKAAKNDGITEGAKAERKRIQDIEAAALPGFEKFVAEEKFKPEATETSVIKAQHEQMKAKGADILANLEADAGDLPDVTPAHAKSDDDKQAAALTAIRKARAKKEERQAARM